jgi:hypothetical protein
MTASVVYRSRGPVSILGATRPISLVSKIEELLEEKVAVPV